MFNTTSNLRHKMIEQQIRPWRVTDLDVLHALELVKRELFVEENQESLAFSDIFLPIHGTQEVMLEPKLEARALQAIKPHSKDTILEIGTGSGYMAALLAYFGKSVTTVEVLPELADFALKNLNRSRIPNVRVEVGDGLLGWHTQEQKSYDIICISGGVTAVPEVLKGQLTIGGRLFAYVGDAPLMQAVLITRLNHEYFQTQALFETLVPMLHSAAIKREVFEF